MAGLLRALERVLGPCDEVQYGDLKKLAYQAETNGFKRRIIFEDPFMDATEQYSIDNLVSILDPLFRGIADWPKENPIVVRTFTDEVDGMTEYESVCFLHGIEEGQIGDAVSFRDLG